MSQVTPNLLVPCFAPIVQSHLGVEAIASRLEVTATRLEAIALRLEAIASIKALKLVSGLNAGRRRPKTHRDLPITKTPHVQIQPDPRVGS